MGRFDYRSKWFVKVAHQRICLHSFVGMQSHIHWSCYAHFLSFLSNFLLAFLSFLRFNVDCNEWTLPSQSVYWLYLIYFQLTSVPSYAKLKMKSSKILSSHAREDFFYSVQHYRRKLNIVLMNLKFFVIIFLFCLTVR